MIPEPLTSHVHTDQGNEPALIAREPSGDTPTLTWGLDGFTITATLRDGTYTHDGDDRSFTLTRTDKNGDPR